jgi:hypothetical protein
MVLLISCHMPSNGVGPSTSFLLAVGTPGAALRQNGLAVFSPAAAVSLPHCQIRTLYFCDTVRIRRVTQRGDNLAISAELIDATDNSHIWGQQYSRKPSDIFTLQQKITKEITKALRVRLTGEEEKRLAKIYTANPEAYQDYLKGRYWWNKRTEDGFDKAIGCFQQAIARDPTYALAYCGLADCYSLRANYGFCSPTEGYSRANEAAPAPETSMPPFPEYFLDSSVGPGLIVV